VKLDGIWIGDLDRLIFIEQPVIEIDSVSGQRKISSWTTVCKMWANRMQVSKEYFEVDKQVANNSGQWVVRYHAGIDETMRVNDKGEYHYITGIRRIDRNSFLVLMTEKRDG
jgi:head-tail adaptor